VRAAGEGGLEGDHRGAEVRFRGPGGGGHEALILTTDLPPTLALLQGFVASPSGHWTKLSPPTAALISAAAYVRLPLLSRSTLPEWLYRVTMLQDAGLIFSYFISPDGPCPYPIRSSDLLRHLGATFSLIPLSNLAFDHQIRLNQSRPY
jgi:hypothetical protein